MPSMEMQEIMALKGKVSRLEARLEFLYKHLNVTFVEDVHAGDDPKVIAALKANNMMEAIRLYRTANNAGLDEAKAAIDDMRARLGI